MGSSSNIFLKVESTKVLTIFLNFLNVTIGFDACFSERMNAILKTWLGLLFSGYVFALIFILIQLSKYSSRFARLFGKGNPVATLATLMLLFYAKLLRYTIKIFSFAIVKYPNGSHMTVWRPDASVKYFSSVHTPLFMIGLLIIAVGLVYTILVLLAVARPIAKNKDFKMVEKFKAPFVYGSKPSTVQTKVQILDRPSAFCTDIAQPYVGIKRL